MKTREAVALGCFALKGGSGRRWRLFFPVCKQRKRQREKGMMNVMEEEGKIMKVEISSFHQVGYVPSQACAVSQSDSSRLISPHRGTVNPPLLI